MSSRKATSWRKSKTPFFNHWEVMDDDGFYYVLKRSRTDGVGEVQVGVSKGTVEQRYVRIDDGE